MLSKVASPTPPVLYEQSWVCFVSLNHCSLTMFSIASPELGCQANGLHRQSLDAYAPLQG